MERRIVIGLIISTDYCKQIESIFDISFLEAQMAKIIASWCFEYFNKYKKAPGKDIENIYYSKLKAGLNKETAEEIEELLTDLSEQSIKESFNLEYLLDESRKFFKEKRLELFGNKILESVEEGDLTKAEKLALEYKPISSNSRKDIDLSSPKVLDRLELAYKSAGKPIIKFPKALGDFLNEYLIRGGFVAFMGPEKRGKTFVLIELAMRAVKQKNKVAFFQAGDMSEGEQLVRTAIYLTKNSNKKKYCGKMWEPCADCIYNQLDTCDKKERECDFGIFEDKNERYIKKEITKEELIEVALDNPDYIPCHNCIMYKHKKIGAIWLKEVEVKEPLSLEKAKNSFEKYFIKNKRRLKLDTYPMNTLTVRQINSMLDIWEKEDGFIPDVIIIDYADLLVANDTRQTIRDQQNEIWKNLRRLSQEKHCLVITATQTDSDSYKKDRLSMSNFSEDKRKYGHVTAMFGLNQDSKGREKELGIMILNEIVVREGDSSIKKEVTVLQNLRRGRPFIGSF